MNKKKKRKGKGKGKNGSNNGMGDDDDEMDGINSLSPEKQLTCSLILQELNNKMRMVAWKPMWFLQKCRCTCICPMIYQFDMIALHCVPDKAQVKWS